MRRALVGSDRLGPGCLVLRADTRENPGGKNGVMTAGVIIFPMHPGSRINLLRVGKTLRAKAAVREKKCVLLPARFFSNLVPVRAHI
jgi:hypothetical protein